MRGAPASVWRVELAAPGWWMDPVTVTLPPSSTTVQLPLFRVATYRGTLAGRPHAKIPNTLILVVESPPWSAHAVRNGAEFQCPVATDGSWTCTVPATKLGFAIIAADYVPEYRWDIHLRPGKVGDAGVIRLREGGSVSAWIAPIAAQADVPPAQRPQVQAIVNRLVPSIPSAVTQRLMQPVAEAVVAPNGFVQLAPIDAGTYALEFRATGFATARIFPLTIIENRETTLRRAIELSAPVRVSVTVEPPVDPTGAPWKAEIHQGSAMGSAFDPRPVFSGHVAATGAIDVAGQSPGTFRVRISDAHGNRMAQEQFEVPPGGGAPVAIQIPVVRVRGKVRRSTSPLAATLWFGGEHGVPRVELMSDDQGDFAGWLPHKGRWLVEVRSRDGRISTAVHTSVQQDEEVLIEIPATRVTGTVFKDQQAVANARVMMLGPEGVLLKAFTDDDGAFAFHGALPGAYSVVASSRAGGGSSPFSFVLQNEKSEVEKIRLSLRAPEVIVGRVMAGGLPVVAARIEVAAGGTGGETITDIDGSFTAKVAAHADRVSLFVRAPGRALTAFARNIGDSMDLELDARGGTLQFDITDRVDGMRLFQNGIAVPVQLLLGWAEGQGIALRKNSTVTVPNVAVGEYRLCRVSSERAEHCANGTLLPGATLALE
ncbi:MAG TPA: carboxypeptidase-like regulatory domain-containing protein [Thermoanaerobaculia bacterium]